MEDHTGVHVWLVLMKAHAALLRHAHASIEGLHLCDSDFFVLEVLLHKGPLPVNAIGQKVRLTSGSISIAIDRLVQRGLVERCEDAGDRRVRLVGLTPAGDAMIGSAFKKHSDAMETAAAGLTQAERVQIVRLLKKLGKTADAQISS